MSDEELDDLERARLRGAHQRCRLRLEVFGIYFGAALEQQADHLGVSTQRGALERKAAIGVVEPGDTTAIDGGAGREQELRDLVLVVRDRNEERCPSGMAALVRVG